MSENTTTLPYATTEDISSAAQFIAALIPTGVTFQSIVTGQRMIITFTGGY
jgi:hypothetical protein